MKSVAIESIKFSGNTASMYDGGQSAQLNQEFAQIYCRTYAIILGLRAVLMVIFCPDFLFTNCMDDAWAPEEPTVHDEKKYAAYLKFKERNENRNFKVFLITTVAGGTLLLLHTLLYCLIRKWANERKNFNSNNNMLSAIH